MYAAKYATIPVSGYARRPGVLAGLALIAATLAAPAQARAPGYVEPAAAHPSPAALVYTPIIVLDVKADLERGFAMLGKGHSEKAVGYFDRVIAAADGQLGNDPRPRRCVTDGAAPGTANVVSVDEALCDAHFGRGYALIDLGRGDLAEADLRAAAEMAPDNAHFANEYAELFKSRRDWTMAYALFEKAWNVADKTMGGPNADLAARALRGMGYAQEKMGHLDTAHDLIARSLQFEPASEAGRVQLAHVERMQAIGN